MTRFTAIVSIVLAVLLVFASAAGSQAAPKVPRVAMLCAPACSGSNMDAFYDELRKLGWIEVSSIVIERKEAASHLDELAGLAADLLRSTLISASTAVCHASRFCSAVGSFMM
jgi:putative tryptophan/tyrosine transport system substrate-binding protein